MAFSTFSYLRALPKRDISKHYWPYHINPEFSFYSDMASVL
jgi:hypothetical protein